MSEIRKITWKVTYEYLPRFHNPNQWVLGEQKFNRQENALRFFENRGNGLETIHFRNMKLFEVTETESLIRENFDPKSLLPQVDKAVEAINDIICTIKDCEVPRWLRDTLVEVDYQINSVQDSLSEENPTDCKHCGTRDKDCRERQVKIGGDLLKCCASCMWDPQHDSK